MIRIGIAERVWGMLLLVAGLAIFGAADNAAAATTVDLTLRDSYGFINGARFMQLDSTKYTVTGIDTFLSLKAKDNEEGFNTTGTFYYDQFKARALLLSEVAVATINGTDYREFSLDLQETTSNPTVELVDMTIHIEATGAIEYYADLSTPIYDMNPNDEGNKVVLDSSLNPPNSSSDMLAHIPSSLFGTDEEKNVYLYCKLLYITNGPEEWAVTDPATAPEPATICLLILGSILLLLKRRRFKRFT